MSEQVLKFAIKLSSWICSHVTLGRTEVLL